MASPDNRRVFVWKAFGEWNPVLEDMFKGILTEALRTKVRQHATGIERGEIGYLELIGDPTSPVITIDKINELRQRYSHIRLYHGCRPEDISSYYDRGLCLREGDSQVERFRSIFLSGKYPELTEQTLQESISRLCPYPGDDEELCLAIDDRWVLEHCGNFLIYGSEHLMNLVVNLPRDSEPYLSVLRKIGKPTVFEINLPNTRDYCVTDGNVQWLIHDMISEWVYRTCHPGTESGPLDFTVSLRRPLPPEHICSHYHPSRIPDPLMGRKVYVVETGGYADTGQGRY